MWQPGFDTLTILLVLLKLCCCVVEVYILLFSCRVVFWGCFIFRGSAGYFVGFFWEDFLWREHSKNIGKIIREGLVIRFSNFMEKSNLRLFFNRKIERSGMVWGWKDTHYLYTCATCEDNGGIGMERGSSMNGDSFCSVCLRTKRTL